MPYRADELGPVPCVCLRIPTGGGKTLMAAHAIPRIAQTWANRPFPVALWLTPSESRLVTPTTASIASGDPLDVANVGDHGDDPEIRELRDELAVDLEEGVLRPLHQDELFRSEGCGDQAGE